MVELVHEDRIVPSDQSRESPQVGEVTRGKDQRRFLADESGQFVLKPIVEIQVAVQEAATRVAAAVPVQSVSGRLEDARIVREAHVVVGPHHHLSLTVDHDGCVARLLDWLKVRIQADRSELSGGGEVLALSENVHDV
ncbi:MAG: hypothetical protein P8Y26_04935 [Gemmatimonadales bacterium]